MKKSTSLAIWIPVIVTVITSFTTVAVTLINALSKANAFNSRQTYGAERRQMEAVAVSDSVAMSPARPEYQQRARVVFSLKGFKMSTNQISQER